jgi:hypothetical protein
MNGTKRIWLRVLGGMLILGGLGACANPGTEPTTSSRPSESTFSDDSCYSMSKDLLNDHPSVYSSRQNAYDSCREAGDLVDELVGEVGRY